MFCVMVIICVHFDRWPMKIKVREMIEPAGGFCEVCVSTPIEVCEQRDRKGLHAKARCVELWEGIPSVAIVSPPYWSVGSTSVANASKRI